MLGIAVPSGDEVKTGFMLCLLNLVARLNLLGVKYKVLSARRSDISMGRSSLVETALREECDEILWLDSDMVFPGNVYEELKETGHGIVGCTYRKRDGSGDLTHCEMPGSTDESDIRIVGALAGGCLLVRTEIYKALGTPYYGHSVMNTGQIRGEDYTFCVRARKAGFETYLHLPLSKNIGHLAEQALFIEESPSA